MEGAVVGVVGVQSPKSRANFYIITDSVLAWWLCGGWFVVRVRDEGYPL